ncbi:pyrroline-5-carboxylate reductase [Rhynchospora pubera]|uniref:Pyrroline-5-carboxylate reductase n=1 Tax=Rhynchospora pubera TaxID=906938 RepID=A0AAV8HT62_9POAL|nr:pyrroline-5-carboxylate reductase [Rhynchospora pubera]
MADPSPSPPPPPPPSPPPPQPLTSSFPPWSLLLLKLLSKRRTWVCLFLLVYSILILSSWSLLLSIRSWYATSLASSDSPIPALYASVLYGAVFGLLSMGAALAVAVPATVVMWITVLVLLAFAGRRRRALVEEGRRATKDIVVLVARVLLKEGNLAAALCALASFVALIVRRSGGSEAGTRVDL